MSESLKPVLVTCFESCRGPPLPTGVSVAGAGSLRRAGACFRNRRCRMQRSCWNDQLSGLIGEGTSVIPSGSAVADAQGRVRRAPRRTRCPWGAAAKVGFGLGQIDPALGKWTTLARQCRSDHDGEKPWSPCDAHPSLQLRGAVKCAAIVLPLGHVSRVILNRVSARRSVAVVE